MSITRRGFVSTCIAAAGGLAAGAALTPLTALPRRARAASARVPITYFQSAALQRGDLDPADTVGGTRSRLNVLYGEGGNTLIVAEKGGWVLVDTKNAPFGVLLKNHLRYYKAEAKPPGLVINTHHHADHTGGNHAFLGLVPVVAHPQAIKRVGNQHMRYQIVAATFYRRADKIEGTAKGFIDADVMPLKENAAAWEPKDFIPDRAMDGAMETIVVGEGKDKNEVELYHFGTGHTDNDVVVRFPKYNVIHVGDLCFSRSHAVMDRGSNGNSRAWTKSLDQVMSLCNRETIIVPGHGEVTDIGGLKEQVRYFDVIRAKVTDLWKSGKQRRDAEDLLIEEFKDLAKPEARANTYGAIYDEVVEEQRAVEKLEPIPDDTKPKPKESGGGGGGEKK